jgi:hypothetical protein
MNELFTFVFEAILEKEKERKKDDFAFIHKSLKESLERINKESATASDETLRFSLQIASDDFEALLGTIESIEKKLAISNPHYTNPHPMTTEEVSDLLRKYADSRDSTLLQKFNDLVADVILREDTKMASEVKFLIGETGNKSKDYIGSLYGYETTLAHFLILHNRLLST